MAKKRYNFMKRRSAKRSFKRSSRRSSGSTGMKGDIALIGGSMIYGAGREFVSTKLAPITSKIPAGELSDEVGMGVLSYFLYKGKIPLLNKIPMSRDIGRAGLIIESARAGEYLVKKSGLLNVSAPQNTSSADKW